MGSLNGTVCIGSHTSLPIRKIIRTTNHFYIQLNRVEQQESFAMFHLTENNDVPQKFQNKMSLLRQVKGISKKKLKAQEYNLKRKMGICYRCTSTNHTLAKCPENQTIKPEIPVNAVQTIHENEVLPPPKIMETCTDVYRIPAKKIPNNLMCEPTLVVAFKGYEDRNIFFQSLKNLKELIKIQKFLSIKTNGIC